jgi:hypothetical protein
MKKAELDWRIGEVDKSILENRTIRPDQYEGPDAEQLKRLAQAIIQVAVRMGADCFLC